MGKFVNSDEELIFKLFTVFDISIIEEWLIEGLNKTKFADKYKFEKHSLGHQPYEHRSAEISNYNFKVVLFYDDDNMYLSSHQPPRLKTLRLGSEKNQVGV